MSPSTLAEAEFSLIKELARNPTKTQRELSGDIGLSLGMTNVLLKRLARKGLLKTRQLTWNKVQYILTPKGMMEKTKKSFYYAAWTLRHVRSLVAGIRRTLDLEYHNGLREFYIVSQEDTSELVQMALDGLSLYGARIHRLSRLSEVPDYAEVVFLASDEPSPERERPRCIFLMEDGAPVRPEIKR